MVKQQGVDVELFQVLLLGQAMGSRTKHPGTKHPSNDMSSGVSQDLFSGSHAADLIVSCCFQGTSLDDYGLCVSGGYVFQDLRAGQDQRY